MNWRKWIGLGSPGAKPAAAATGLLKVYGVSLAVCAGLSAGVYFAGVQPALEAHEADRANAADLQERRQKASDLAAVLNSTRQKLGQAKAEVDALPLRLEPASAINQRLARLADLAVATGLTINEVQPGAATGSAHYQSVPLRVSGTGTYPACARFLHRLRDRFPDTAVRSFEAANPSPARGATAGTFRFELTWYTAPAVKG